jgi:hypothetical protein
MNTPNSSSNALSAREATGLVEGNGVFVSGAIGPEFELISWMCGLPEMDSRV